MGKIFRASHYSEQWNDEAIQELVILVAEVRKCSSNMNYTKAHNCADENLVFSKRTKAV